MLSPQRRRAITGEHKVTESVLKKLPVQACIANRYFSIVDVYRWGDEATLELAQALNSLLFLAIPLVERGKFLVEIGNAQTKNQIETITAQITTYYPRADNRVSFGAVSIIYVEPPAPHKPNGSNEDDTAMSL